MNRFLKSFFSGRIFRCRLDDDCVDRLSRHYTVVLLVCVGFIAGTKQLFGDPIRCWCPNQFKDKHCEFAEAICLGSETYYFSMLARLPETFNAAERKDAIVVNYYQWIPLILLLQAVLMFAPCLVWRSVCKSSSVNVAAVMDAADRCSEAGQADIREDSVRYIVDQIAHLLKQRKRCGCYLVIVYLAVKVLYVLSAAGQLYLLDMVFMFEYRLTGLYILERALRGMDDLLPYWYFPRITQCQIEIRSDPRNEYYNLQCVLPMNLFYEKIFICIWFWNVFIALITTVSALVWLGRSLYCPGHVSYLSDQLRGIDATSQLEKIELNKFTQDYMRQDAMFLLKLIGNNMGEAVAREVICGLWYDYSLKANSADRTDGSECCSNTGLRARAGVKIEEV